MKPQTQRWNRGPIFSEDEQTDEGGDCFSACIASILEVPLEGFPNFLASDGEKTWFDRWLDYLYEHYRCTLMYWEYELPDFMQLAWWIGEVQSGTIPHSVAFHQREFKWDPLPDPYKHEYKIEDIKSVVALYSIASIIEQQ